MNDVQSSKAVASIDIARISSREDRLAAGKALRDKVQRADHRLWKAQHDRPDPISILQETDADRFEELVPIKYGRMLQSPFAFYRGAAAVMASDLAHTPASGLKVQCCGDCHLANFGGFATPERNIIFDINDFDETLPAPWEWDVKRLAASVVLAARSIGLSDIKAQNCAEAGARSYRKRLCKFSELGPLEAWYQKVTDTDVIQSLPPGVQKFVRDRIDKVAAGSGSELDFPKLAGTVGGRVRIREQPPLIFHPEQAKAPEFQSVLEAVFNDYRKTLSDDLRVLLDRHQVIDAAIKVVGIGSVGRRCWIALLMSASNDPLFLQFKEAGPSALERFAGESAYGHSGQRVVMGQRLMQPVSDIFLGWVTAPNGRQFYVRQLRDAKIKPLIESFDAEWMEAYAKACGWVLARAHSKGSNVTAIAGYLGATNDVFDKAIAGFAIAYADQAERDHAALKSAVKKGKINVLTEA
ncbi:DUF2252 domain-containing protein [Rhizobium ruizarguesonis]|uniref:DUF2252 domain-containing protein n=1 Tax=Rhizobium ruizarguesonis TaxID=2081791 RepID=UPI0010302DE4|nr:DUF2252 domain-containing protein [Rhizobium ruizarguesonis]TAY61864.1 DUF2252 domain-containing protein [Rhizobium ruizarguesonis]